VNRKQRLMISKATTQQQSAIHSVNSSVVFATRTEREITRGFVKGRGQPKTGGIGVEASGPLSAGRFGRTSV